MTHCWNCHKKVEFKDLVDVTYKGYDMFVCKECKEELEAIEKKDMTKENVP